MTKMKGDAVAKRVRKWKVKTNGEVFEIEGEEYIPSLALPPLPVEVQELGGMGSYLESAGPYSGISYTTDNPLPPRPEYLPRTNPGTNMMGWVADHNHSVLRKLQAEEEQRRRIAQDAKDNPALIQSTNTSCMIQSVNPRALSPMFQGSVQVGNDENGRMVVTKGGIQYKLCVQCEQLVPVQWFTDRCYECLQLTDTGGG